MGIRFIYRAATTALSWPRTAQNWTPSTVPPWRHRTLADLTLSSSRTKNNSHYLCQTKFILRWLSFTCTKRRGAPMALRWPSGRVTTISPCSRTCAMSGRNLCGEYGPPVGCWWPPWERWIRDKLECSKAIRTVLNFFKHRRLGGRGPSCRFVSELRCSDELVRKDIQKKLCGNVVNKNELGRECDIASSSTVPRTTAIPRSHEVLIAYNSITRTARREETSR